MTMLRLKTMAKPIIAAMATKMARPMLYTALEFMAADSAMVLWASLF